MDFRCEGELIAFRLGHADYPILDGGGAFKYGSRWCSPGRYIVHAATAYSLAVLENVVHWRVAALPPGMQFVRVSIPAAASRNILEPGDLRGWDAYPYGPSRLYGDAWYDRMDSAVLVVPSVLSPFEPNVLINQRHPEFGSITGSAPAPAILDPRLVASG
ncbi:MAG: RES domain-containing protein [Pseudomonadota bacterium]|nr:RES domain-containing protein [Pseudomonadota bacterium]